MEWARVQWGGEGKKGIRMGGSWGGKGREAWEVKMGPGLGGSTVGRDGKEIGKK